MYDIIMMPMQEQEGFKDCGLFSICSAAHLAMAAYWWGVTFKYGERFPPALVISLLSSLLASSMAALTNSLFSEPDGLGRGISQVSFLHGLKNLYNAII